MFQITTKVEFTKIKCTSYGPDFANFDFCFLKSKNRTYKYLSLKLQLLKGPVTKVRVGILSKYYSLFPLNCFRFRVTWQV